MSMSSAAQFPRGFLWGAAGSGHQIEGSNVNSDSWLVEHVDGTLFVEPSGDACDHYHRFATDIALLAELGYNSYRFSVEWSRVEPAPGETSRAALDHYRRVLEECHAHGLTPLVTLNHFTTPRWFAGRGGWLDAEAPERFADYCATVTRSLGDAMPIAFTLNEPNIGAVMVSTGLVPPEVFGELPLNDVAARANGTPTFRMFPFCDVETAREQQRLGHESARQAIRSESSTTLVGQTLAVQDLVAVDGGEDERARAWHDTIGVYLPATVGDDIIGVQTYTRLRYGPDGLLPPSADAVVSMTGAEHCPPSVGGALRSIWETTGLPLYMTENGISTDDDRLRVELIDGAVDAMAACIADGIDVRGYTHWSIFDNFEWNWGHGPTFGLIAVDRATQARTPKPSAHRLGEIARANGSA
jgi:beta-glucosidase